MLRRRLIMMCQDGYRWIKAKISVLFKVVANLTFAQSATVKANRSVKNQADVKLTAHNLAGIKAESKVGNTASAELKQQTATEINANKNVGVSVVARLVGYLRAPLEYFEQIRLSRKAKLTKGDAIETKAEANIQNAYHAEAEQAKSDSVSIKIVTPQPKATATPTIGAAQMVGTQIMPKVEHTAALSWWIYPEIEEDGTLYIRQAYNATLTDGVLEMS